MHKDFFMTPSINDYVEDTILTSEVFIRSKKNLNKSFMLQNQIFDNCPRLAIIKPNFCESINKAILILESSENKENKENQENDYKEQQDLCEFSILNALSSLADNQQQAKVLKSFLTTSTNYKCYSKMKQFSEYLSDKLVQYLKSSFCVDVFKYLNDSIKMQLDQQIQNILFFESQNQQQFPTYNSAFLAAYLMFIYNEKVQKKASKTKLIFIDLSGIENQNKDIFNLFSENDCLYISLQKSRKRENASPQEDHDSKAKKNPNYFSIYIDDNQNEITWKQFQFIYKHQIKKIIKQFKQTLFIISFAKIFKCQKSTKFSEDYQNNIKFSEYCQRNIIQKFSYLARDKLIIHCYIGKEECDQHAQAESGVSKVELNNKGNQGQLIVFINSLQQGLLSEDIMLIDRNNQNELKLKENQQNEKELNLWLTSFIQLNQKQMKLNVYEQFQRQFRNLINNQEFKVEENQVQKFGICVMNDNFNTKQQDQNNYKIVYLYHEGSNIQFLKNTILYVDYIGKTVVLLQYENQKYYIYFTKHDKFSKEGQKDYKADCQRIQLPDELEEEDIRLDEFIIKNSSLIVDNSIIYIMFNQNGQKIIKVNCISQSVQVLGRKQALNFNQIDHKLIKYFEQTNTNNQQEKYQTLISNRRKPAIVKNKFVNGFNFVIFGGEFVNSNQICNLVELVQIESDGFSSVEIPKGTIFQKCHFYIPWPNMLVLNNNQQPCIYILLPGDYNNKNFCFNQVINKEHQQKAIVIISSIDSFKFEISYLKIVYDNSKLQKGQKPLPIEYFSGNQINIQNPEETQSEQKWRIAVTLLDQQNENLFLNTINVMQLFIMAEIQIKYKTQELIIKQQFERLESNLMLEKIILNCEYEEVNINCQQEKQILQDCNVQQKQVQKYQTQLN